MWGPKLWKKGSIFNFNQSECIGEITEGYYLNDSNLNTIDKCHSDCKTCKKKETINNTNCNSCNGDLFLNLGNCVSSCDNGNFLDLNNNKICKCPNNKCLECSLESLNKSLCISCNTENNFYPLFKDSYNESFFDCYNETPDGYFLYNNSYNKKCWYL